MLRNLIKRNKSLLILSAYVYRITGLNRGVLRAKLRNTIKLKGVYMHRTVLSIAGSKNTLSIDSLVILHNCRFTIIGRNNNIRISTGANLKDMHFWCQGDSCAIEIGRDCTMEGGHVASTEGVQIHIGNDCMFANDIEIRSGDSHSIVDLNGGGRINHAKPIFIGNHVWLGAHVRILKGVSIASNTIIGNSSLVTRDCKVEHCIYAGIPARQLKENIDWKRQILK